MARLPKYVRISISEESYAPDGDNWWAVRSDYPTGDLFEIGGIFSTERKATNFALEQAEHYRDMMDDHAFMVVVSDGKKDRIIS